MTLNSFLQFYRHTKLLASDILFDALFDAIFLSDDTSTHKPKNEKGCLFCLIL